MNDNALWCRLSEDIPEIGVGKQTRDIRIYDCLQDISFFSTFSIIPGLNLRDGPLLSQYITRMGRGERLGGFCSDGGIDPGAVTQLLGAKGLKM